MAKLFSNNVDKRVIFPRSKQREFLEKVAELSGLPWQSVAEKVGVHERTLFDWRREKYSISLRSLKKMCDMANLSFPENIKIKEPFWSVYKAAKKGGKVTYGKYGTIGNPKIRQKRWREWWEKEGKHNLNKWFVARDVFFPNKSPELAEFVGIMIGDGGMTRGQITISLNPLTDREYVLHVEKLVKRLFKVEPSINKRRGESVVAIRVSRTKLVSFCKAIGLLEGNKIRQNLDMPEWIKEEKEYYIPCVRGIMDTDGCLFMECHKMGSKKYCYPRLSLVSASPNLRRSVYEALKCLGFSPRIRNERSVQIERRDEIKEYFDKIGSSNTKHTNKFRKIFGGVG